MLEEVYFLLDKKNVYRLNITNAMKTSKYINITLI